MMMYQVSSQILFSGDFVDFFANSQNKSPTTPNSMYHISSYIVRLEYNTIHYFRRQNWPQNHILEYNTILKIK